MTTESSATLTAPATGPRGGAPGDAPQNCAIAVNAAKVLDTTRRAWGDAVAQSPDEAKSRAPRAAKPKRIAPRRSRWPSLIAALHYWSPKPL